MTREEELIRLLVRESIKEDLELNELLGNLFNKAPQQTQSNELTPQAAKMQLDNHNSGKVKINDPQRLKKIQDIVNKNFPQQNSQQSQKDSAFGIARTNYRQQNAHLEDDIWGRAAESKKRRKAALR